VDIAASSNWTVDIAASARSKQVQWSEVTEDAYQYE